MSLSVLGMVKGDLPNGKWAHRPPTPDEQLAHQILGPWLRGERDEKGRKVALAECVERLGAERERLE